MQTLYCISGLGADENVFQYLDLSFAKPVFIKWKSPLQNETLGSYALRLKQEFIHEPDPIIFGLSLGGMIAVELAKAIPSAKVIIISSAKTTSEIPYYLKIFRYIPVHKILPGWLIRQPSPIRNYFLGAHISRTKDYIRQVAKNADADFYRWAVDAILTWQNKTVPLNVTHIHGMKDNLLPYKFVTSDISIDDAGHLMIIENADKVSVLLKKIFIK